MSRVILTGHMGFLGSHVLDALIEKDHEVYGIDNGSTGRAENTNHHSIINHNTNAGVMNYSVPKGSFISYTGDIVTNSHLLSNICREFKPDAIIHLAAQPSLLTSEKDPAFDARTNIIGTIHVIQAAKKHNARLIFASTSAVYNPTAVSYNEKKTSINPSTPYGISKASAEMYIRELMPDDQWCILRLGNVYGPRQLPLGDNQLIPRLLGHIFNGKDFEIYGDGTNKRPYIYVKDVARAILDVTEMRVGDAIINIANGFSWATTDVVEAICEIVNYDQPISYNSDKTDERENVFMDTTVMKNILGTHPMISLEAGLETTIDWWKDNMGAT